MATLRRPVVVGENRSAFDAIPASRHASSSRPVTLPFSQGRCTTSPLIAAKSLPAARADPDPVVLAFLFMGLVLCVGFGMPSVCIARLKA